VAAGSIEYRAAVFTAHGRSDGTPPPVDVESRCRSLPPALLRCDLCMTSEPTPRDSAVPRGDRSETPRLMEASYDDFRRLARAHLSRQPDMQAMQPTAVVHEVFLRLAGGDDVDWRSRSHFFAVGATAMRQILVDHARRSAAAKRGGGRLRIGFDESLVISPRRDEDVLALEEALRALEEIDETRARMVELRFYGGLTIDEIVEVTGTPRRTVQRQWEATRLWLRRQLTEKAD
jgi:RNA polymerase sigma-70 factor (ECF subfamily)